MASSYELYMRPKAVWDSFSLQSLAVYFQDSSGLPRTGTGFVRLKVNVALVMTAPELEKCLQILGYPWQSWNWHFCQYGNLEEFILFQILIFRSNFFFKFLVIFLLYSQHFQNYLNKQLLLLPYIPKLRPKTDIVHQLVDPDQPCYCILERG